MTSPRTEQRAPLDRQLIAATAMELLSEVGAEKLTMRALAARLGVTPMAVYHHVDDKDELLRLVGDVLLSRVELPSPDSGPWRELFTNAVMAMIDSLLQYRGLSSILLSSKLLPNARRIVIYSIQQFEHAGLTHEEAQNAYAGIHQLALGRLFIEESANFAASPGSKDQEIASYVDTLRTRESFEIALSALLDHYLNSAAGIASAGTEQPGS